MEVKSPYKKLGVLGRGAFGVVYRAEYAGKIIALKRFKHISEDSIPYQIIREINILQTFQHPNLVNILGINVRRGNVEVCMEICEGNLRQWINKDREYKLIYLKDISYQIIMACSFLHHYEVIHRDIKPENILLSFHDKALVVKLCDFSISKKIAPFSENHTYQTCTLPYRAPELFVKKGAYGREVDIWSIACVLYEYVLGERLFGGDSELLVLRNILSRVPTSENDLLILGLDNIRLEKCNHQHYKLPLLYPYSETNTQRIQELEKFGNLSRSMLCLDPSKRSSLLQCLKHPYFNNKYSEAEYQRHIQAHQDKISSMRFGLSSLSGSRQHYLLSMVNVAKKYTLHKQTLLTAFNVFDEYCNSKAELCKDLHSSVICCLVIASKYVDTKSLKLKHFSNEYSLPELIEQERHILHIINYRFNHITLLDIYETLVKEGSLPSVVNIPESHWKIILELSLCREITNINIREIKKLLYSLCQK